MSRRNEAASRQSRSGHLFPEIPRALRAPADAPVAAGPYTDRELDAIRSRFLASGVKVPCPRCREILHSVAAPERASTGAVVWCCECRRCGKHAAVRIRASRPPAAPGFDRLVASRPQRPSRGSALRVTASIGVHAVIVVAAVAATRADPIGSDRAAPTETTLVLLAPPTAPEPPRVAPPPRLEAPQLPKGFQTVVAPVDAPVDLPPIDMATRFDPRDYTGQGVEGGVFDGMAGGVAQPAGMGVYELATVDEPPERIGGPPLRYPRVLREAGIEGYVIVAFIVNAEGRADSAYVVSSTERAFEGPALDVVRKGHYRPGRVRGQPVAVLAELRVEFNLLAAGGER